VKFRRLCTLAFVLIAVAACSAPAQAPLRLPRERRLVSLVPSLSEDLCAIGAGHQLVGVSSYSNDVPCAKHLPVVGDFASVDAEKILRLHPDSVLAIASQAHMTQEVRALHLRVEFIDDLTYDDLFSSIRRLGVLTGRSDAAAALDARLRLQTAALQRQTQSFKRHPSVFVVLGVQPVFTVGSNSYIATLISLAGGRNAVGPLSGGYSAYGDEALLRLQPDVIVADPSVDLQAFLDREPWRSLKAVRAKRVWTLPDAAMLERPGPRFTEGVRWLVNHLKPIAS
jgi:iron complex transport system substrate-binding protein